jgi:hypothetical protein
MTRSFSIVDAGVNTQPIAAQLDRHPELWNVHSSRSHPSNAYFTGTDDIWLRFRAPDDLKDAAGYVTPFIPEFYPAWRVLDTVHDLVFAMLAQMRGVMLGGILITRIPPGGQVKRHHDRGRWHAEYFDTKLYMPIATNRDCVNEFHQDRIVLDAGDVVSFDNLRPHAVENNGTTARTTLIVCMKGA